MFSKNKTAETTRNRLLNMRCYTIGAMDCAPDGGVEWRDAIEKQHKDKGIQWLHPHRKPIDIGREDAENRDQRRKWKAEGRYDLVAHEMKIIRCVDLRLVDIADFFVCNIDLDIFSCGTFEEVTTANRQKKPIITRVKQGKEYTPDWLLGTIPHKMIFSTWDEVDAYINHVAHDAVIDSFRRWYFFDFHGTGDIRNDFAPDPS